MYETISKQAKEDLKELYIPNVYKKQFDRLIEIIINDPCPVKRERAFVVYMEIEAEQDALHEEAAYELGYRRGKSA